MYLTTQRASSNAAVVEVSFISIVLCHNDRCDWDSRDTSWTYKVRLVPIFYVYFKILKITFM